MKKEKYASLRIVCGMLQILAAFIGIGGVAGSIIVIILGPNFLPYDLYSISGIVGVVGIIISIVSAVLIYALSDLIQCIVDIERNTRQESLV